MSGGQFRVHGPHDHAIEYGAQSGDDLATFAAITVLTPRRWLYWGSMTAAGAGIAFWVLAWVR